MGSTAKAASTSGLLLLVAIIFFFLASKGRAAEVLEYVPEDAKDVLYVNTSGVTRTLGVLERNCDSKSFGPLRQAFERISYLSDGGAPAASASGEFSIKSFPRACAWGFPKVQGVIETSLPEASLLKLLSERGEAVKEQAEGLTVYGFTPKLAGKGKDKAYFSYIAKDVVFFSDSKEAALGAKSLKARSGGKFAKDVQGVGASCVVWARISSSELLKPMLAPFGGAQPGSAESQTSAKSFSFALCLPEGSDIIELQACYEMKDLRSAEAMRKILGGFSELMKMNSPEMGPALTVDGQGESVSFKISVDQKLLKSVVATQSIAVQQAEEELKKRSSVAEEERKAGGLTIRKEP